MPENQQSIFVQWAEWHALVTVAGLTMGLTLSVEGGLFVCASLSFIFFVFHSRGQWTSKQRFGWANTITSVRIMGILYLLFETTLRSQTIFALAVILFALDAADGWLARRYGLVSEFGEYFDKEADALFMLVLCLLLYRNQGVGLWVLFPGTLRYLFVVFMRFAKPVKQKESRNQWGCWIFFLMMSSLILCFTPYIDLFLPVLIVMTVVLVGSFAHSIKDLYVLEKLK